MKADMWWTPDLGDARPEDDTAGQVMVVSREYVANQVRSVIQCRERWLTDNNLALDTNMDNKEHSAETLVAVRSSRLRPPTVPAAAAHSIVRSGGGAWRPCWSWWPCAALGLGDLG